MADDKTTPAIALRDLIESFAASIVATSQRLDQATADLRNLYQGSGNAGLAALLPPRFTLDEVSVDLAFVVIEARPEVRGDTDLPKEEKGFLSDPVVIPPDDLDSVRARLAELVRSDARAALDNNINILNAALNDAQQKLKDIPIRRQNIMEKELPPVNVEAVRITTGLKKLKPPPADAAARKALLLERTRNEDRRQDIARRLGQLNKDDNDLSNRIKQIQQLSAARSDLKKQLDDLDLSKLSSQLEALGRIDIKLMNLVDVWDQFYPKYQELKQTYESSKRAFKQDSGLPKIRDFSLREDERAILGKIQDIQAAPGEKRDWNKIKNSVKPIYDPGSKPPGNGDYVATLNALAALVKLVTDRKGAGLQIRVDPKAFVDVPAEARHKLHLTFRGQSQESVKIGDKDVDIAR